MKIVYDHVHPQGSATDGWPGMLSLVGGPLKTPWDKRHGGELRWEERLPLGGSHRMVAWWTKGLTAERAAEHVQKWERPWGTHYVMWWEVGPKLYDLALFWIPEEAGVTAPNEEAPPWAGVIPEVATKKRVKSEPTTVSPRQMTLKEAEAELGRLVYEAAIYFERLEGQGLWSGNGHHAAQALQQAAVERLRKSWKGPT